MHKINKFEKIMQDIDVIDIKILKMMQADALLSVADIAEKVGVGSASCWRRIGRMEKSGIIKDQVAIIDPKALGLEVEVSLRITLDKTQTDAFDRFIEAARKVKEVNEIQTFLGRVDVRLNILARDMSHYQEIYRSQILLLPHIADIEALMLISNVMSKDGVPL
ncbi:Lrp/AsnC family transcriptional regulator [Amylibacter sp.]|jgi:Lrp/AsnC family transcriptional regulator|nr:Lrp/AsnC family transcriptional regulator [Amylibacter sp.]MDC0008491.1 Lrp/AsnC family transcriptional regulator [Amylibacter sp.]|tara:strand:- start:156 stop:647 length:492 start_codon:yes stop_codon:yes gene_type:complete